MQCHLDACFVWTDPRGETHLCEGPTPQRGEMLIWTLCDLDIMSPSPVLQKPAHATTCSKCRAALAVLVMRQKDSVDLSPEG